MDRGHETISQAENRRGYALIEMAATMAVGSLMVGVAVSVLYLLLDVERDARDGLRLRGELGRLGRQFRDDVHAAVDFRPVTPADAEASPPSWELRLEGDRVIRYGRSEEALWRRVIAAGEAVAGESFALPPAAAVAIELLEDESIRRLRLRIGPGEASGDGPGLRVSYIDAVLAHDHRFALPEEP